MIRRFLGHCQICEQLQKLHGGTLVHHGYKRPGHGEIVGDCYGVHEAPYEVSADALQRYLPEVRKGLKGPQDFLQRLEAGEVTTLTELRHKRDGYGYETVEFHKDVELPYTWKRMIEKRIYQTQSQIRMIEAEIVRIERRIAAWTLQPIRTLDEEEAAQGASRAARAAEHAAKKAAKAAARAALDAKKTERETKRAAILQDFASKFQALAQDPTPKNRALADVLYRRMNRLNLGIRELHALHCDDAFIRLGLAFPIEPYQTANGPVRVRYS